MTKNSVRHQHERNKGLGVKLSIDRTLIFYLAAKTQTKSIEVATTLLSLSDRSVSRLRDHGGSYRTNHFVYPGTKIMLTAKAEVGTDHDEFEKANLEWRDKITSRFAHLSESNIYVSRYNITIDKALTPEQRQWIDSNPKPVWQDFKCMLCDIRFREHIKKAVYSQYDIDNYLIENILLNGE